jgi:hypothetical protein
MLSELSSGEYRYPDLRFIVTIHHVFSWWIFGIGEVRSVVSKLLRFACFFLLIGGARSVAATRDTASPSLSRT